MSYPIMRNGRSPLYVRHASHYNLSIAPPHILHHSSLSMQTETLMFKDISDVRQRLGQQQYITSEEIATVTFLAQALSKPILAEGPAGVGKTELAKAWAKAIERPLIRLQCSKGWTKVKRSTSGNTPNKCSTPSSCAKPCTKCWKALPASTKPPPAWLKKKMSSSPKTSCCPAPCSKP
ncbi:MAG: AAA family ATPase [Chloroflexi bacterium]|nr:AAA family ATPase [Chloroflexota bacterium]